jgi:hypothetical protein
MSGAYAAIEAAEDELASCAASTDIAAALETCASEIESVKDEYQDGLDSLPDGLRDAGGPGGETQEKIDALESFAESLQSAASDIEGAEFEPGEGKDAQTEEEWLEDLRSQASDALGELSV